MIIAESSTFSYAQMTQSLEMRAYENDEGEKMVEASYSYDYVEINMTSVRAQAMTDDIIDFISDYFHAQRNGSDNPGQQELRSFYSEAKEALDNSFNSLKGDNSLLPGNSINGALNGNGRKLGHFKNNSGNGRKLGHLKNNDNGVRGNNNLLQRAHEQAVKDLKNWYHNGGEPRERVDFSSIEIEQVSMEQEVTTIASEYAAGERMV